MDAWQYIRWGWYEKAAMAYGEMIRTEPNVFHHYRNRALAYLNLGRITEARLDFEKSMSLEPRFLETKTKRYNSDANIKAIGVTYWLEGNKEKALDIWTEIVEALRHGRVDYSDLAGGVGSGLLLWFAGVHLSRPDSIQLVRELYEKLAKRKWMGGLTQWPGPIAKYFLGIIDKKAMQSCVARVRILRDRELCQAYFARAVRSLQNGERTEYQKIMAKAASIKKALLEDEYYLAKYENSIHRQGLGPG